MDAAGVVAGHAAQRAVRVRGGIGREREVMSLGRVSELVADDPELHPRRLSVRMEFQQPVHVF
jgi:hypothetical protein